MPAAAITFCLEESISIVLPRAIICGTGAWTITSCKSLRLVSLPFSVLMRYVLSFLPGDPAWRTAVAPKLRLASSTFWTGVSMASSVVITCEPLVKTKSFMFGVTAVVRLGVTVSPFSSLICFSLRTPFTVDAWVRLGTSLP